MATPWDAPVKGSKQLTVFPGPGLLSSAAWGAVLFKEILAEFNRLSSVNKLGVTLKESNVAPGAQGSGGANVQIEVSPGTHTFNHDGQTITRSLPGTGIDIGAVTHPITQGGVHIRAFVFVPVNPTIGGANSRGVGKGVKIAITLHELIHACGLDEKEHSPAGNPDLFMTGGQLSSSFPPDKDRLDLGSSKFAPPIFITARTAGLIQRNWI